VKRNLVKALTLTASFVATMPLLQTCGISLPVLGDIVVSREDGDDDLKDELDNFFDDLFDD
jgi:hypothetical protein